MAARDFIDELNPFMPQTQRMTSISSEVQVCNSDNEITAINARYGGRANDQRVYRNSAIRNFMERRYDDGIRNFWILGDSGYTLTPTLITPFHNPERGSPSERFNIAFVTCRSIVERTIGILKARWRCLRKERALHYDPVTAGRIVNMCCVLHNICRRYGVPDPAMYRDPDVEDDEVIEEIEREDGEIVRQQIVNEYFL
ncbi:putative nuclease HARBI1 [Leptopilina boulardi]|uniref:putative nuclease HARBI1 n=1 Tax=Leptopilina boulardi TaxID=63433 RepID=UPI0021F59D65|nr:putative nuclease HARBI1 [Leptopilina boulardi]